MIDNAKLEPINPMEHQMDRLLNLAKDRALITPEKHPSNDFYGHATVLKSFVGRPLENSTNCAIAHGPMHPLFHWDVDINAPLPVLLSANAATCTVLKNRTDKLIYAVGPLLHYASPHLSAEQISLEKRRLGRNLLVFPMHSTHHLEACYDSDAVCREIEEIGRDFDTVTICLYWKDILNGVAPIYAAYGFNLETAGHIYDCSFLNRLRTLFALSDAVLTYSWSSALGFAVSMKKPVMARKAKDERFIAPQHILDRDTLGINANREAMEYRAKVLSLFKEFQAPTREQLSAIDYMWGITQTKTPDEIEEILLRADDIVRSKKHKGIKIFLNPPPVSQPDLSSELPYSRLSKDIDNSIQSSTQEFRPMKTLRSVFQHGKDFYGPVILNPSTLVNAAISSETWTKILDFHHLLATDEYVQYLDAYYRESRSRFGSHWFYLDIVNTLFAASSLLQPRRYLEIGVRRGRSAAVVAKACPSVDIVAFDMWIKGYAGMENPGPNFVMNELSRMGHTGSIDFHDGNSHETVPAFFQSNPKVEFDLITVDGDHSRDGALQDLMTVVPRLAIGGVLVFDDIAHPQHHYLLDVWLQLMHDNAHLSHYAFVESGFGVAFAIRTN